MKRILKNGDGWRIGWNPQAEKYKGLVGNEEWAIELTELEFNDFCRLLTQLAETIGQMQQELMDRERIAIEAESDLMWLEIEGYPHLYSLRLIIHHDRRCEGNWSEGAANRLAEAVLTLKIF
jgi:predicted GNAT superfamily acetyltransferase